MTATPSLQPVPDHVSAQKRLVVKTAPYLSKKSAQKLSVRFHHQKPVWETGNHGALVTQCAEWDPGNESVPVIADSPDALDARIRRKKKSVTQAKSSTVYQV